MISLTNLLILIWKQTYIFDLLRDENRRLENAPSVSDYVLDGNKEKEIDQAFQKS